MLGTVVTASCGRPPARRCPLYGLRERFRAARRTPNGHVRRHVSDFLEVLEVPAGMLSREPFRRGFPDLGLSLATFLRWPLHLT